MAQLRFIHAESNSPNVDIYIDGRLTVSNLSFSEISAYLNISSRRVGLAIFSAGTKSVVLEDIAHFRHKFTTVAISGGKLVAYRDDHSVAQNGHASIRLIHLVDGAGAVNLKIDEKVVASGIRYSGSDSTTLKLGKFFHTVSVSLGGGVIVGPLIITPGNRTAHTLFVVGDPSGKIEGVVTNDNGKNHDLLADNFNVQNFMNRWVLHAEIPQPYIGTSECKLQTADYTLLSDGVKVFNRCLDGNKAVVRSITGKAVVPNPLYPAALRVSFPDTPSFGTPSDDANYLVHVVNYGLNGNAFIGSPNRSSYYLLSRRSRISTLLYNNFISTGKQLGYDTSKIVKYTKLG